MGELRFIYTKKFRTLHTHGFHSSKVAEIQIFCPLVKALIEFIEALNCITILNGFFKKYFVVFSQKNGCCDF